VRLLSDPVKAASQGLPRRSSKAAPKIEGNGSIALWTPPAGFPDLGRARMTGRWVLHGGGRCAAVIAPAVRDWLAVSGEVWLGLYLRSNRALVEDSAATRAHAGYRDIDETGRIVKPMDDDVDIENALAALG
jgi:hypothetical protein